MDSENIHEDKTCMKDLDKKQSTKVAQYEGRFRYDDGLNEQVLLSRRNRDGVKPEICRIPS